MGHKRHLPWTLIFLLGFSSAVGAACSPMEESSPATQTQPVEPQNQSATDASQPPTATAAYTPAIFGEVRIWTSWGPESLRVLNDLVDEFQEIHPGVKFSLTFLEGDQILSNLDALDPAAAPTVIFGPSRWGPDLSAREVSLDLVRMLPPDLVLALDPLSLSQVEVDEKIIGLPLQMNGSVLFRNRELAGSAAVTISGLRAGSELVEQLLPDGAVLDLGFERSSGFSHACGGPLIRADGSHAMSGELGLCWLGLLQTFSEAGRVVINSSEDEQLFQEGRTAWIITDSGSRFLFLESLGPDQVEVDRWPVYQTTGTRLQGYVWTENAYLLASSAEPDIEASLAFLLFLLRPESQLSLSESGQGGMVPVLATLESTDPLIAQIQAALRDGIPFPLGFEQNPLVAPLQRAARAVVIQGAEIQTAQLRALEEILELQETLEKD